MEQTAIKKPFMSIRETARYTGLSEYFLRDMQKSGCLPGVYTGRKYCVNVPALLAQIERKSNTRGGAAL